MKEVTGENFPHDPAEESEYDTTMFRILLAETVAPLKVSVVLFGKSEVSANTPEVDGNVYVSVDDLSTTCNLLLRRNILRRVADIVQVL